VQERRECPVARHTERAGDKPEHRREVTFELLLGQPCARRDERVMAKAARRDVEQRATLRSARAVRDMVP
jgi:hypothetical protein